MRSAICRDILCLRPLSFFLAQTFFAFLGVFLFVDSLVSTTVTVVVVVVLVTVSPVFGSVVWIRVVLGGEGEMSEGLMDRLEELIPVASPSKPCCPSAMVE